LEYSYEPGAKAFRVWLNDQPLEALTLMGMVGGRPLDPVPPIEAVRFGTEVNATEAFFDDIAVHTDHIGCN
jgi:hypothetical protein